MGSTRKQSISTKRRPSNRIVLEQLDPRVLLNATCEWSSDFEHSEDDLSAFIRPGYGVPDAFHSDPVTWDLSANNTIDLSSTANQLSLSDQSEPWSGEIAENNDLGSLTSNGVYTLYLDFDGDTVYSRSGDFWLGKSSIETPAYDLSMFGWGGREQESINYISQFVSEDYAAYSVNVTTTKPTSGEYTTIYVGGSNEWFMAGSSVIGVATYDVGNVDASNFGFAFTEELGIYQSYSGGSLLNFSEYISNLITHEAGHTFGANHISDTSATMNPYLPITPRTTCFGAGSNQDTQTLLGTNIGYAHGPDEYGDSYTDSESISSQGTVAGLLERRDDVDAFTFTASASGTVTVDLDTTAYSNLDATLAVYRNSGFSLVAQNDDYNGSDDPTVEFSVVAGQQYTIYVASSAGGTSGSYWLNLTPPATGPSISVSDSSGNASDLAINFGSIIANTTTSATFTISNTGTDALVVSRLIVSGDFTLDVVNGAGSSDDFSIAAGSSRTITANFSPDNAGYHTGSVTIMSNDTEQSSVTLNMTGTAQQSQSDITVSSAGNDISGETLDFGDILRNITSTKTITLANNGSENLIISDIDIDSPFTIVSGFSGGNLVVAPGHTSSLVIGVSSGVRGSVDGQVTITSNDPDEGTTEIDLAAQITGGVLTVNESYQTANDNQIDFGTIYMGEQAVRTITLVNSGDGNLTITGINVDEADFVGSVVLSNANSGDDIVLGIGESMTITISYSPDGIEEVSGNVTISTNDCESPEAVVGLSAEGKSDPLEITEADGNLDGTINFGHVQVNQQHQANAWVVTNHGNSEITICLNLTGGSDFEIAGGNTVAIPAGGSYIVAIDFESGPAIDVTDIITLTANDYGSTSSSLVVTADPYALIGRGSRYSFTDNDGDKVNISLSGSGYAEVALGGVGQTDIESIILLSGADGGNLNINVAGNGRTQLGSLTGNGNLKSLNTRGVDLAGTGIDLSGSIERLSLGDVLNGADIHFDADKAATVKFEHITGDSDIEIAGSLRMFQAVQFSGGSLTSNDIAQMRIGETNADIEVTGNLDKLDVFSGDLGGNVYVHGSIGAVRISRGNLTGDITATDGIDKLLLGKGTISGNVTSQASIQQIRTVNIEQANIYARYGIDRINVSNDLNASIISIGYDTAPGDKSMANSAEINATLGTLSVKGTFSASTVAVGVAPEAGGNFIEGSAYNASGTIGSVRLKTVETDNQNDPFGIIARDNMSRLRVNSANITATDYQLGDFYATVLKK
jgi:hypothetical protein